jgi:hypothetical protein
MKTSKVRTPTIQTAMSNEKEKLLIFQSSTNSKSQSIELDETCGVFLVVN